MNGKRVLIMIVEASDSNAVIRRRVAEASDITLRDTFRRFGNNLGIMKASGKVLEFCADVLRAAQSWGSKWGDLVAFGASWKHEGIHRKRLGG